MVHKISSTTQHTDTWNNTSIRQRITNYQLYTTAQKKKKTQEFKCVTTQTRTNYQVWRHTRTQTHTPSTHPPPAVEGSSYFTLRPPLANPATRRCLHHETDLIARKKKGPFNRKSVWRPKAEFACDKVSFFPYVSLILIYLVLWGKSGQFPGATKMAEFCLPRIRYIYIYIFLKLNILIQTFEWGVPKIFLETTVP